MTMIMLVLVSLIYLISPIHLYNDLIEELNLILTIVSHLWLTNDYDYASSCMSLIYLISPIHLYNDLIAVHHYEKSLESRL